MIKIDDLLNEIAYKQYETLVYVEFKEDSNISTIAQIVRALPYVAVVNNKSDKDEHQPRGLLLVKCVSTQTASETFNKLQELALKVPDITKFKFSEKHLETKEV
jgi:hypothetical protein